MSEFRCDPLTGKWVIIAPDRIGRPYDYKKERSGSYSDTADDCPFCPGHEDRTPPASLTLPPSGPWQVRVVPNRYPAVEENPSGESQQFSDLFKTLPGQGIHEVLIESPDHNIDLAQYSAQQMSAILSAIVERCRFYRSLDRCETIFIFRNWGARAGASLIHGHLQIGCLPLVSQETAHQFARAKSAFIERGCAMCAVIEAELSANTRIVAVNDSFVAFCPFAAIVPYQTTIVPRRHLPLFDESTADELRDFADILTRTTAAVKPASGSSDYNIMWKLPPVKESLREAWHWSLDIMPRTTIAAGFEYLSGIYINVVAPEQAAARMRDYVAAGEPAL